MLVLVRHFEITADGDSHPLQEDFLRELDMYPHDFSPYTKKKRNED